MDIQTFSKAFNVGHPCKRLHNTSRAVRLAKGAPPALNSRKVRNQP